MIMLERAFIWRHGYRPQLHELCGQSKLERPATVVCPQERRCRRQDHPGDHQRDRSRQAHPGDPSRCQPPIWPV